MNDRELKGLCRALGDVSRLRMVRHLAATAEVNVTELAGLLMLSQPLTSWHVRILKRAGILTTRRNGRQVYCSLDRRRVSQLLGAVAELIQPQPSSGSVAAARTPEPSTFLAEYPSLPNN
ncbi:MAG: helix-turn-helix transcriptional regulator [Chloroflexota bacterium]|nr:helix-turn-helix transcriptional regulator [Chloroflexota bacterium]